MPKEPIFTKLQRQIGRFIAQPDYTIVMAHQEDTTIAINRGTPEELTKLLKTAAHDAPELQKAIIEAAHSLTQKS